MNIKFEATESTKAPLFLYEGKNVHVAAATYSYLTQTDEPNSGALVIVVDGYLDGETAMKRFICNMTEDTIEIVDETEKNVQNGRIFEKLVEDKWVKVEYDELQANDVIRIIDNGKLYFDLNGNSLWMVIGKDENGDVQIVEAIRKDENDG